MRSFAGILSALTMSASAWADSIHQVKSEETVWFLAQVYYDDGTKFKEILFANHMKGPDDLKAGEEIVIPLPKFSNKDAGFKDRYLQVKTARGAQLAAKKAALAAGGSEELVASRRHASVSQLKKKTPFQMPFTSKDFGNKGARESAEDELKRASSGEVAR